MKNKIELFTSHRFILKDDTNKFDNIFLQLNSMKILDNQLILNFHLSKEIWKGILRLEKKCPKSITAQILGGSGGVEGQLHFKHVRWISVDPTKLRFDYHVTEFLTMPVTLSFKRVVLE